MTLEEKAQAHVDKIFLSIIDKYQSAPWPEFRDALAQIYIAGAEEAAVPQLEDRYCIVPKEVVLNEFESATAEGKHCHPKHQIQSRTRLRQLYRLFDKSLFEAER